MSDALEKALGGLEDARCLLAGLMAVSPDDSETHAAAVEVWSALRRAGERLEIARSLDARERPEKARHAMRTFL